MHKQKRYHTGNEYNLHKNEHGRCYNIPRQVFPSPLYPAEQVQMKLPTVLVQVASAAQPPLCFAHSSIST